MALERYTPPKDLQNILQEYKSRITRLEQRTAGGGIEGPPGPAADGQALLGAVYYSTETSSGDTYTFAEGDTPLESWGDPIGISPFATADAWSGYLEITEDGIYSAWCSVLTTLPAGGTVAVRLRHSASFPDPVSHGATPSATDVFAFAETPPQQFYAGDHFGVTFAAVPSGTALLCDVIVVRYGVVDTVVGSSTGPVGPAGPTGPAGTPGTDTIPVYFAYDYMIVS